MIKDSVIKNCTAGIERRAEEDIDTFVPRKLEFYELAINNMSRDELKKACCVAVECALLRIKERDDHTSRTKAHLMAKAFAQSEEIQKKVNCILALGRGDNG